jgi:hypothetical protein
MATQTCHDPSMVERLAYSFKEAAEAAAVSETIIRRAYRAGDLRVHYPTSRPVILAVDLEEWLINSPQTSGGLDSQRGWSPLAASGR